MPAASATPVRSGQERLFDEAELLVAAQPQSETEAVGEADDPDASGAGSAAVLKATIKRRGKRVPLPAELPRVDIVHEIAERERRCACGSPMVEIGADISKQLDLTTSCCRGT